MQSPSSLHSWLSAADAQQLRVSRGTTDQYPHSHYQFAFSLNTCTAPRLIVSQLWFGAKAILSTDHRIDPTIDPYFDECFFENPQSSLKDNKWYIICVYSLNCSNNTNQAMRFLLFQALIAANQSCLRFGYLCINFHPGDLPMPKSHNSNDTCMLSRASANNIQALSVFFCANELVYCAAPIFDCKTNANIPWLKLLLGLASSGRFLLAAHLSILSENQDSFIYPELMQKTNEPNMPNRYLGLRNQWSMKIDAAFSQNVCALITRSNEIHITNDFAHCGARAFTSYNGNSVTRFQPLEHIAS